MNGHIKSIVSAGIRFFLIFLWVYASVSKLADYERSRGEMLNQIFSVWLAEILVWAVPLAELSAAALLLFNKTRLYGLLLSSLLLLSFSVYIALVMLNVFNRLPCSCGGVLNNMSWGMHLLFNLFFLALALCGLFHDFKERRWPMGEGN